MSSAHSAMNENAYSKNGIASRREAMAWLSPCDALGTVSSAHGAANVFYACSKNGVAKGKLMWQV